MKKNYNSKTIKTIKTVLRCFVMMLMVSCGQDSVKDQINLIDETETELEGTDEVEEPKDTDSEIKGGELFDDIYQKILEYDFSVQEYPIDTTRYAGVVEQEFLKAFYDVLLNCVPLDYGDSGEKYFFRDQLGGLFSYLSDEGFVELFVKNTSYRLIDMDRDGLPELAVEFDIDDLGVFGGICILKYDMEEKRVTNYYFELLEGWGMLLLGPNRFGLYDIRNVETDRSEYIVIDEQGETIQCFDFEMTSMNETRYTVSGSGEINGEVVVIKEEWDELTDVFFDAMSSPIEFMTYEEVFGDVANCLEVADDVKEVQQSY